MNLDEQLEETLHSWPFFSQGEAQLAFDNEGRHLSCILVALDTLACAFTNLELRTDRLIGADIKQLQRVADNLSKRLTYLLEPIGTIETDAQGCVVQMRSLPPKKRADHTDYYELLVTRQGVLSLRRYSRAVGSQRIAIPAQVTREVLVRLAGDFAAAATVA